MPGAKDPVTMMVCTESFSANLGKQGHVDCQQDSTILPSTHPAVKAHPQWFKPVEAKL